MGFAINPSLKFLDIPESSVYELYRSSSEVLLPDARFHGHPCEAYICLERVDGTVRAYVALLEKGMNTVFVFTSDYSTRLPAEYPNVYAEAEAFVKKIGFVMEPVKLDFSPAMREVIIRGFRVMKPPAQKKQPPRKMVAVPVAEPTKLRMATPLPDIAPAPQEVAGGQNVELESLQRELASSKAVIAKLTRDKVSLEQTAAAEISSLKASCEQAMEAKRQAEENFAREAEKIRLEERSGSSRIDDEEKTSLRADLEKVAAAARANEKRLQEEAEAARQKIERLENDRITLDEKLAAADAARDEQIKRFAEEKESLLARIAIDESSAIAIADKVATIEQLERSWKESQHREDDLCRNLDLMKEQLDILSEELRSYKEKEGREEELQLKVSNLEQELETVKSAAGSIVPEEIAEQLQVLQNEKTAIETEYVRFVTESREKEQLLNEKLAAAEEEVRHLSNELETNVQVAAMEHAALRAELRRLITSGGVSISAALADAAAPEAFPVPPALQTVAVSGSVQSVAPSVAMTPQTIPSATSQAVPYVTPEAVPLAVSPVMAATEQPPPAVVQSSPPVAVTEEPEPVEEDTEPDRPISADRSFAAKLTNEFGGFVSSYNNSATEFSIDPDLSAVVYREPEDILLLIYSSNSVQAVPDNSKSQRCKAFVIVTRIDGQCRVYAAWYLMDSKRVVICVPEQQPADSEECLAVIQDAISYFEIIGFMMEIEDLGESLRSYNRILRKVPALRRER